MFNIHSCYRVAYHENDELFAKLITVMTSQPVKVFVFFLGGGKFFFGGGRGS